MKKITLYFKLLFFAVLAIGFSELKAQSCSINTNVNGNAGTGNYSGTIGQVFKACGSGTLATIKVNASNTSAATAKVSIYNGEGTNNLLGTSDAIAVSSNRTNTWNIENLNIKVVSGQKYTAVFTAASGTPTFQYSTSTQYNYYADGYVLYVGAANNDMFFSATIVKLNPTLTPTHLATNVSRLSPITMQFEKAMKVNSGNIILKNLTTNLNVDTIPVAELTIASSLVTIPHTLLDPNTQYQITIPATALSSTSGISYEGIGLGNWTFTTSDGSVPVITTSVGGKTNATTIPFSINFTEAVTGFELSDLVVTNGTASNFTGSGTSYTVDITPSSTGTVSLQIPANVVSGTNETATKSVFFDNVIPVAIAKNDTIQLSANGVASITAASINNGSTDNSTKTANLVLSLDRLDFNCSHVGLYKVILSVQDSVGNIDTASAKILVLPAAPLVTTKNITVQLLATGSVTILPADVVNTSQPYCNTTLTFSLDTTTFTCADLGANTVTLTANDGAGNIVTKTAIVTVQNKNLPTVVTKNIDAQVDLATSKVTITPQMVNNGSAGLCGGNVTLSLSKTSFTCAELGANTVTLTVTDAQGNVKTGTAIVNVLPAIENQALTAANTTITNGTSTTISTASSQQGVTYTLRNNTGNAIVGTSQTGTGNPLVFNTGNLSNTQTFNVLGESNMYNNTALDFDGVNDYVSTNVKLTTTSTFTIEAWVYPRATAYGRLISNYTNIAGDIILDTYHATNNGKGLRFLLRGSSTQTINVPNVLTLNDWNHVAVTFNSGAMNMFVNGALVGQATAPFTSFPSNNNPIRFGEDVTIGTPEYFNGKMDDIRIWNTARTGTEILDNMNSCLSGTETALKAYFKISEGSGTTITDIKGNTSATLNGMDATNAWVAGKVSCLASTCTNQMTDLVTITVENPTSIDGQLIDSNVLFSPNPATNQITTSYQVEIFTITGVFMLSGTGAIDISSLPKGLYVVKSNNKAQKLIKE